MQIVEKTQQRKEVKGMANRYNFNYSALLGLMRENGYTQEKLAQATGISLTQLCGKLNGKYPFKQDDIQSIVNVLNIAPADICRYFFTLRVEKTQQNVTLRVT